jgi:hypothetical protein
MATQKALEALKKTTEALKGINAKLQPVLQKLNDNDFDKNKPEAKATVALSIGMMRYMGARLRGLDQGRKPDDPLRKELNNMKKVLAEIKKKHSERKSDQPGKKKPAKQQKIETSKQKPANSSKDAVGDTNTKAVKETPEKAAVETRSKKRGTPEGSKQKKKRRKS